jgi:hypothetical protein
MILVNTTKRINIIATQTYEDQDLAERPAGNGMPDGMFKIIPSVNEISVEDFKKICSHPNFNRAFSKGQFFLVGKTEIVAKMPMVNAKVKVQQLKKQRAAGEIKGYTYSPGPEKTIDVKTITTVFEKALATFPKNLNELKDLLAYDEADSMKIAENTMYLNHLNRWLKVEKTYQKNNEDDAKDLRDGVVEMIEAMILKVKAFDAKVAKARGEEEAVEA